MVQPHGCVVSPAAIASADNGRQVHTTIAHAGHAAGAATQVRATLTTLGPSVARANPERIPRTSSHCQKRSCHQDRDPRAWPGQRTQ